MAVDQTTKAIHLCTRLANAADMVRFGLAEIEAVRKSKEDSGIDFNDPALAERLAESTLKHASGDNFNGVITAGTAIRDFVNEPGQYRDDVLESVSPGTR